MQELLDKLIPNVMARLPDFYAAIGDTLLMVVWSGAISFVLGLILGVLLTVTKPGGILENKVAYQMAQAHRGRSGHHPAGTDAHRLRRADRRERGPDRRRRDRHGEAGRGRQHL